MTVCTNTTLTDAEKESILRTLTEIIAIPSVKGVPTEEAPYGKETLEALEYMLDLGRRSGFIARNLDGRAGYIEWGTGEKMVGILCHLDVVPAGEGWSHDPFTLRRENGWLIGRGINDDKGPAVTVFYAMLRLKESGWNPPCRIRLIMGIDEECGSSCMKHYVEVEELPTCGFTPDADFPAIFAEKGILQVRISGPASSGIRAAAGERANMVPARCHIEFTDTGIIVEGTGIPAHGSKPELGKNAIYDALSRLDERDIASIPLLAFFMAYIGADTAGERIFPGLETDISGALTCNAGVLKMDESVSELTVDIRYPVTLDGEKLFFQLRDLVSSNGLSAEILSHQLPLFKDPEEPLIRTLVSVYEKYVDLVPFDASIPDDIKAKALEKPARPVAIGGGTYARSMPGLVAFGPAFPWERDQAHQVDEAMNEESVYLLVRIFQDAISGLAESV